jgi:hypothetical protein
LRASGVRFLFLGAARRLKKLKSKNKAFCARHMGVERFFINERIIFSRARHKGKMIARINPKRFVEILVKNFYDI